jgi:hypothetical protein
MRQEPAVATVANRVIWWLFFTSPLTYIHAVDSLSSNGTRRDVFAREFPALLLVSLLIAGGTRYWRQRALVEPIRSGEIDLSTPEGKGRAFTPFVLNVGLSAAIAILGVVLSISSSVPYYAYAFCVASMLLMYLHRPNSPDFEPLHAADSQESR